MKEIILLYNILDDGRNNKIKKVLRNKNIVLRKVSKNDYKMPIFQLLTGMSATSETCYRGEELSDEMIVLAIRRENLDSVLAALKDEGIYVPYKAVVTEKNGWWNSIQLFNELRREHEEIKRLNS